MAFNAPPPSAPALASRRKPLIGEDEIYAKSRRALLAEEIDLRRRMARVAEIRRALPPGPLLKNYLFSDRDERAIPLRELFGEQDVLILYACDFGSLGLSSLCFHFLAALQGNIDALQSRVAYATVALAPARDMERFAELHHWQPLNYCQIVSADFAEDLRLFSSPASLLGTLMVLVNTADGVRLFWKSEIGEDMADPGHSPRDMFDLASLWTILDHTPQGRYPQANSEYGYMRRPLDEGRALDGGPGRWPRPVFSTA